MPSLQAATAKTPRAIRVALTAPYRRLFLGETLATAASTAVASALAINALMHGASAFVIALLVALIALPVVVVSPLVRPTIERYGVYRTLLWTHGIVVIGLLAAAVCALTKFGWLYPYFALDTLIGLATAFHGPAVFASLSWFVGEEHVPLGIATVNLRTALTWMAGPLLGGVFAGVANGAVVLLVAAAATACAMLPLHTLRASFRAGERVLHERQQHDPRCVTRSIEQGIAAAEVNGLCMLTQAPAVVDRRLWALLRDRDARFALVLYGACYASLGAFTVLLTPWARSNLHLSAAAVGTVLSLRSTASMPGPLLSGWFVKVLGMSRTLVGLGIATGAVVAILATRSRWDGIAVASVIVYGALFYCLTSGVFTTLFTVVVGPVRRTEGAALFALVKASSSIVFVALGLCARAWGAPLILGWCGAAGIAAAVLLRVVTRGPWNRLMTAFRVQRELAVLTASHER